MLTNVSGMVGDKSLNAATAGVTTKNTSPDDGKLPHTDDPIVVIAAKAGLVVTAGRGMLLSNDR